MSQLVAWAKPTYRLSIDEASLVSVPFLDLEVLKIPSGPGSVEIRFRAYIKPTSVHLPLHASSAHPMAVHSSWPLAEVQRMHRRCQSRLDFIHFRLVKTDH